MLIIGLHGGAKAGKDTIGRFIAAEIRTARYAFADPVRRAVEAITCGLVDFDELDEAEKDEINAIFKLTPREMLEKMGAHMRAVYGDDILLRHCRTVMQSAYAYESPVFCVTDVRMPREIEFIKNKGGVIWHIKRNTSARSNDITQTLPATYQPTHDDIVINNNGTLEELRRKTINQLENCLLKYRDDNYTALMR